MATYGDMQARIADELDRPTDLTEQIKKAILTAVKHYERKTFYFSESSFTFSTVAQQENYTSAANAAIATTPNIERLNGLFNATRTPITKRPWKMIDDKSATTTSYGQPEEWAYRAETIRFYPIPDAVYTITAYSTPRLTELSADTESNAWTTDAEELIRTHAKIDLMLNVIRGPELAEEIVGLRGQERTALVALITETAERETTGFSTPTQF